MRYCRESSTVQQASCHSLSCGGTSPGGCARARTRCLVAAARHCWNASRSSSSSSALRPCGPALMLTLALVCPPALAGRRRGVGGRNVSCSESERRASSRLGRNGGDDSAP